MIELIPELKAKFEAILFPNYLNPGDINTDFIIDAMFEAYLLDRDKWISVDERLPEVDIDVWCASKDRVMLRSYRGYKDHSGNYLFINYDNPFGDREITHWQPLPKKPNQ